MPTAFNMTATRIHRIGLFAGAAIAMVVFYAIGGYVLDNYALDLGSFNFPTPRYVLFVAFWCVFGGASAALLALALANTMASPDRLRLLTAQWAATADSRFVVWTSLAAFIIPLSLRIWVLQGAPLTDDESAYRFAAQLIATGRLWVPSPPLKIFFDQNFMINDGRFYPVYFLGWPALMAPGVWLHALALVNPVLSALTIWPLYRVLRHFTGSGWARGGVVLFLSAPFVQIAAATELSHTSCLLALTWALYYYLRTTSDPGRASFHVGLGASVGLAFCIRPPSAVALALPLVIGWLVARRRQQAPGRALFAFVGGAGPLAVLFLGSLWAQNGSPWVVGYARYAQYITANGFRFTSFVPSDLTTVVGFDFSDLLAAIAKAGAGLFRLNFDLFGWPSSFLLLPAALPVFTRQGRLLWAMSACYVLAALFQRDWGIDTFGPLHAFELALPAIVLTILGARTLRDYLTASSSAAGTAAAFPAALLCALITTAWVGFVPVRLEGVRQIADHVNLALQEPERQRLHRAVVFAPYPFAPRCASTPSNFVLFHPVNDPDLRNDVLWVNQLSLADDRRLLEILPGRTGYVLYWTAKCQVNLVPLGS